MYVTDSFAHHEVNQVLQDMLHLILLCVDTSFVHQGLINSKYVWVFDKSIT